MNGNEEQTSDGFAYDITKSELPTWSSLGEYGGRVATQSFWLQKGDENASGDIAFREVEMRGQRHLRDDLSG